MSADKLIERLRAGLGSVTPGPWGLAFNGTGKLRIIQRAEHEANDKNISGEFDRDEDAEFLILCSPENIRTLLDLLASIQADNLRLRKALEPFAKYMGSGSFDIDNRGEPLPDEQGVGWVYLKIGDFRRATRSLSQDGEEGQ